MSITLLPSFRDPIAAGSHLAALVWSVYAFLVLLRLTRRGPWSQRVSVAVFGGSMVMLYGASGLYHALRLPEEQLRYFRMIDHSAIYCLIAGTYTPIFVRLLQGRLRAALLGVMWSAAGAGIVALWTMPRNPYPVSVAIYLALGYIGLVPMVHLARAVGLGPLLRGGILGGVLYTAGAVGDMLKWPVIIPGVFGSHEMLHLCVIGGTLVHFQFIVRYVLTFEPVRMAPAAPALPARRAA